MLCIQAVRYDSPLSNMKYCIQQLMHEDLESECGRKLLSSVSIRDIWRVCFSFMYGCILDFMLFIAAFPAARYL